MLPFGHGDQIIGQTQSIEVLASASCMVPGTSVATPAKLSPACTPCLPFVSVEAQEGLIDRSPLQDCLLDTVSDANPATEWAISN